MTGAVYTHRIDGADTLCFVGEAWLAFAAANGAPELTREAVEGRSLWAFIAGERTRALYGQILEVVRQANRTSRVAFRCDSPDRLRWMTMEVHPKSEGTLEFRCRLLRQESRNPVPLSDPAADDSGEILLSCSLCKRVLSDRRWVELEMVVERRRLLESDHLPRLLHTVCPDCHAEVLRELGVSSHGRSPGP